MKTAQYLDAIKRHHQLQSDYAISKLTGWSKQAISNYRNGIRCLSDEHAIKVAELLGKDPAEVIANVHAERTKSPEERKVWLRIARQFGRAAAVVLFAGQALTIPFPAQAAAELLTRHCILC